MTQCTRIRTLAAVLAALLSLPVVAQTPRPPTNEQVAAQANAQLAIEYLRKGDLATAKDKAERALSQDSRTLASQTAAALVYDRLGDTRRAREHYEQALRYSDGQPDAQNNLAAFLCRTGERKRGEQNFLEAAANPLYRTPEVALTNAARCARADGRAADAEPYLRRALAARPDFPEALYDSPTSTSSSAIRCSRGPFSSATWPGRGSPRPQRGSATGSSAHSATPSRPRSTRAASRASSRPRSRRGSCSKPRRAGRERDGAGGRRAAVDARGATASRARAARAHAAAAAEQLNLDLSVIHALENNDYGALGAPVFAKGHLRKYAALVGLSDEEVARGL